MSKHNFGSLKNLTVINAGSVIAAPFFCALYAEHGANVINIESTLAPDVLRNFGYAWSMEHRNERCINLNIPSDEGKEILFRMLKTADILVESSKGGTWAKWGLTDDVLWGINPKLVIVHISGYGQEGVPEYVNRASYDPTGQAFSGYLAINGMPDPNPPLLIKPYGCDYVTGFTAAWAALAAYINAQQTGKGDSIDIAQYEAMLRIQSFYSLDGFNKQKEPVRRGNADAIAATDSLYKCGDGNWIYIGMTGGGVVKRGLTLLGLDTDPDFIPTPQMIPRSNAVQAEKYLNTIRAFCAERNVHDVEKIMNEAQIPCSKVMSYAMMENDPQYKARENIIEWDDPKFGKVKGFNVVPRFKNNPGRIVSGSPAYGTHNEDVLTEYGYSAAEIESLYEKKVIVKP